MQTLRVVVTITLVFVMSFISTHLTANPKLNIPQIKIGAKSYILLDALTKKVISHKAKDTRMEPASLVKIMTLFIAAKQLSNGSISLEDKVRVSVKAWKAGGSRMFIEAGKMVRVGDLIAGVAVVSGNDASIALAEHISGSEEQFVALMNEQAKELGMNNTHFTNSTGLPNDDLYTTAEDIAILSTELIQQYPSFYQKYESQKKFSYNGINQINRNKLLWVPNLGVDGLKTGHTESAGYNLSVSAQNDNMRLVAVILASSSENSRLREGEKLLRWGFRYFRHYNLYDKLTALTTSKVWMGETDTINLGVIDPVNIVISKTQNHEVNIQTRTHEYLQAPVNAGQKIGTLSVYIGTEKYSQHDLVSLDTVNRGSIFVQFIDWINMHVHQLVN